MLGFELEGEGASRSSPRQPSQLLLNQTHFFSEGKHIIITHVTLLFVKGTSTQ